MYTQPKSIFTNSLFWIILSLATPWGSADRGPEATMVPKDGPSAPRSCIYLSNSKATWRSLSPTLIKPRIWVEEIEDLTDRVEENEDMVEALDSDLADVEDYVFEDDDDCCEHDDDLSEFEVQCPHCDEIVYVDEDELAGAADDEVEIRCPNCNEVIFSDEVEVEGEE